LFTELLVLGYRIIDKAFYITLGFFSHQLTVVKLLANRVKYGNNLRSNGTPVINVKKTGSLRIGDHFTMNSGKHYNQIGRQQPCFLIVGDNARLTIGNNVGMSSTTIICMNEVVIENNVKIGGNTVIYDTDFHSIHYADRNVLHEDKMKVTTKAVRIKQSAFIGAHTTILKGVTIGENAVIGACSVVSNDIPANEIWAGNPAKYIKSVYS
jgi:acetyltransferase-like isoleucine patch superfamily enzyme